MNDRLSRSDQARFGAEMRDWLPAVIAILLLSGISEAGLLGADGDPGKLYWTLAYLVPALWSIRAVVRSLRRADECQRMAQLEAMAIGFGTLVMSVFTAGLLEAAEVGVLRHSVQIAFVGSVLVWAIALMIKIQRIR